VRMITLVTSAPSHSYYDKPVHGVTEIPPNSGLFLNYPFHGLQFIPFKKWIRLRGIVLGTLQGQHNL
jgi:hypothetical protein